jgi:hypothetical protein
MGRSIEIPTTENLAGLNFWISWVGQLRMTLEQPIVCAAAKY